MKRIDCTVSEYICWCSRVSFCSFPRTKQRLVLHGSMPWSFSKTLGWEGMHPGRNSTSEASPHLVEIALMNTCLMHLYKPLPSFYNTVFCMPWQFHQQYFSMGVMNCTKGVFSILSNQEKQTILQLKGSWKKWYMITTPFTTYLSINQSRKNK